MSLILDAQPDLPIETDGRSDRQSATSYAFRLWTFSAIFVAAKVATYAHNQAEVTTPKTPNGFRSLPLYAQLVEMLGTPKKSGYIIGEQKTPITETAYQCMFEKIRKAVDLHGATTHVFRHSYLTMLDEADVEPKTLQYIAGHGNFSFTMNRYVHGRKKAAQEAGVKFEMLINKTSDSSAPTDVSIPSFTVSGKDKTAGVIS